MGPPPFPGIRQLSNITKSVLHATISLYWQLCVQSRVTLTNEQLIITQLHVPVLYKLYNYIKFLSLTFISFLMFLTMCTLNAFRAFGLFKRMYLTPPVLSLLTNTSSCLCVWMVEFLGGWHVSCIPELLLMTSEIWHLSSDASIF